MSSSHNSFIISFQLAKTGASEAYVNYQNNEMVQALGEVKAFIACINSDLNQTNSEINQRYDTSFKTKIMAGVGYFNMM